MMFMNRKISDKILQYPQIGFVKQVEDKKRYGRLKVWIPAFETKEDDESGWILCGYASPFAGASDWTLNSDSKFDTFEETQTSYGFWSVPPDINNEVVVLFPGGDIAKAIWIGCLFKEYMTSMVPGPTVSSQNKNVKGKSVPVVEFNKFDKKSGDAADPLKPTRPWNRPKTEGIGNQGLIKDKIRGIIESSSQTNAAPDVFGWSTPGPYNEGKKTRKTGHTFYMDDDPTNEHIQLSTRSGARIILNETHGFIYLINRSGSGWLQIDNDGNIDIYGKGSLSFRAEENLNLRADADINLEAGRDLYIKAVKSYSDSKVLSPDEGTGGNIFVQALGTTALNLKQSVVLSTESTISLKSTNFVVSSSGDLKCTGDLRSDGSISAGGDISSSKQSLNALFNHTHKYNPGPNPLTDTQPFGQSGSVTDATSVDAAVKATSSKLNITGEYPTTSAITHGGKSIQIPDWWNPKTYNVDTIVDRFITHEPCPAHILKKE